MNIDIDTYTILYIHKYIGFYYPAKTRKQELFVHVQAYVYVCMYVYTKVAERAKQIHKISQTLQKRNTTLPQKWDNIMKIVIKAGKQKQ